MAGPHKVLVLDDEQDLLELYREILDRLPSKPQIHTANSGARALALLESEPFTLLLTDLNMPGMDGFQVLTIARRKYPSMRTVVMTAVADDQFRARAYAMGIDLFVLKPKSSPEIDMFVECIDSLLNREQQGGFRGVQSKSLVDIIQLECLSQMSSVLKITNGPVEAKIWILNGDLIDASVGDAVGEEAFKKILTWKTGNFESLPADPARPRTILSSYQGLLLDSAQSIDEAEATDKPGVPAAEGSGAAPASRLSAIASFNGVEFVLSVAADDKKKYEQWGVQDAEAVAAWTQETAANFRALGERLKAGQLNQIEGLGSQHHIALLSRPEKELCVGFQRAFTHSQVEEAMKHIQTKWVS